MQCSVRVIGVLTPQTLKLLAACAGREINRWKRSYRVQDLALTADGSTLIIAASDKQIHLFRCESRKLRMGTRRPHAVVSADSGWTPGAKGSAVIAGLLQAVQSAAQAGMHQKRDSRLHHHESATDHGVKRPAPRLQAV